jgi:hypothetical protein
MSGEAFGLSSLTPFLCRAWFIAQHATRQKETHMNSISSKFTALAAALLITSVTMGTLGYLFEIQSHPELSVIAFARKIVAYQWLT